MTFHATHFGAAHAVQPGDRVQDKAGRGPWDVIDTCIWEGRPAKECRYYQDEQVTLYHGDCEDILGPRRLGLSAVSESAAMTAPYYQDEQVTLYHGDCEDILGDLADPGQIVITSPPYNMGLVPGGNGRGMYRPGASTKGGRFRDGYDRHNDALPQGEYDEWQRRVLDLLWQTIPDDGAIFYNHRQRIEHGRARLPLGLNFGIPLRQIITWDRGTGIAPNLRHFCVVAEWIFLFAKPEFRLASYSASGEGDVWRLRMATEDYGHPAPFPVSLPFRAITAVGARSVLDPFVGSGTTLVAAQLTGIQAVGIEKSERYCEIAARRLAQGVMIA